MTNIIEILKGFDITIPEEKLADFNKAFAENYKTIVEHSKMQDKLTAATQRAETAEEALKGFEGIDPAKVQETLEEANRKVQEAQENAKKQLEERDYNDALKSEADKIKFSSAAARRDFESAARKKLTRSDSGKLLGFTDFVNEYKETNADAFIEEGAPKAHFTQPSAGGTVQAGASAKAQEIKAIKDPVKRQAEIAKNMNLFKKG